jgi:hypothetical protein
MRLVSTPDRANHQAVCAPRSLPPGAVGADAVQAAPAFGYRALTLLIGGTLRFEPMIEA